MNCATVAHEAFGPIDGQAIGLVGTNTSRKLLSNLLLRLRTWPLRPRPARRHKVHQPTSLNLQLLLASLDKLVVAVVAESTGNQV